MKDVPSSSKASPEKTPDGPSDNATRRPDHSTRSDGQPESSNARERLTSASHDTLRRGIQDIPQSDQPNRPQSNELPHAVNTAPENPPKSKKWAGPRVRNGKLWKEQKEQPERPGKDTTIREGIRAKAQEMVKSWKSPQSNELPQTVNAPSEDSRYTGEKPQKDHDQDHDATSEYIEKAFRDVLKDFKEMEKLENVSLGKAKEMVKQWKTDKKAHADEVDEKMVLQTFPAIREATMLEKKLDIYQKRNIAISHLPTRYVQSPLIREIGATPRQLDQLEKEHKSLVESFPKTPKEVIDKQMEKIDNAIGEFVSWQRDQHTH